MDDAGSIGKVLTMRTLCDDAFVSSAEGETVHGGLVAILLCAFDHVWHRWGDWHWWRAVVVKWELGFIAALCPALVYHRQRVREEI